MSCKINMESIKEMRKSCQDRRYKEHTVFWFYRIFSIYITKFFLILGLRRPEPIVALGFLSGIVGGYLYLKGLFIWGSVLFVAFVVFDQIDGEVARYRKAVTILGGWLDSMSGHILYAYFFFTLGLGIYFQVGVFWYIVLGSVAAIAKLVERSIPQPLADDKRSTRLLKDRGVILIKEWLSHIGKNLVLYPVILLCSILGWEIYFLWFFAIYLTLLALGKLFLTAWRIYYLRK